MSEKELGLYEGSKSNFHTLCLCNIVIPVINIILFATTIFLYHLVKSHIFRCVWILMTNIQTCLLSAIPIFTLNHYCMHNIKWYTRNDLYNVLQCSYQDSVGLCKYNKSQFKTLSRITLMIPSINVLLFIIMVSIYCFTQNSYYLEALFSLTGPNYLLGSVFIYLFTVSLCIHKLDWYERKALCNKVQNS